jgi:hypothetical protein
MKEGVVHYADWEFERIDLLGVIEWVVAQNPELRECEIPIKAYQMVEHGQVADERVDLCRAEDYRSLIRTFRRSVFVEHGWPSWQTGIGGVFYEKGVPRYFLPMIDFEMISTDRTAEDMSQISSHLNKLDTEGSILRSGDIGQGSYFFVGSKSVDYSPNFWRFYGQVMQMFPSGNGVNVERAKALGEKLTHSPSPNSASIIGKEILETFSSIKSGSEREGLIIDPRWVGHTLKRGYPVLRLTPGKSYEDRPLQVAEYY